MKASFTARPVNGPFEDPALLIRFSRERRSILFDCGTLFRLAPGDILKISDIFITHAHIDHFIGFDHVLRLFLGRALPLRIYGPPDIIDRVCGKLHGYTWNLVKEYPLKIEAFGISETEVRQVSFHASEYFTPVERESRKFSGTVLEEPSFIVKAVHLKHDIPCLAYSLEEDFHINIDKAALERMGLEVGPWLTAFKKAIRAKMPDDMPFKADNADFRLGDITEQIARITRGQKMAYVMDSAPTGENFQKIVSLARNSDVLYSEAYFLAEDIERAKERNHLTARLIGRAAREAEVKKLVLMHLSPKYRDEEKELLAEAENAFGNSVSVSHPINC